MALTYPYPLDFLTDFLRSRSTTPDIQRNDEMSGVGSGQFWAAELARPLWKFTVPLAARWAYQARAVDAKIWALGVNKTFLFADPGYRGPASGDPGDSIVVGAIGPTREGIALNGLPANFAVKAGDRISIAYVNGGVDKVYFATFAEDSTAGVGGVLPAAAIFPPVPPSIEIGDSVEMRRPYLKAFVPPGGYTPFTSMLGDIGNAASLSLMQKL